MKNNSLIFKSGKFAIELFSKQNLDFIINDNLILSNFIPAFHFGETNELCAYRIEYILCEYKNIFKSCNGDEFIIKDIWIDGLPLYIIHFIYKLFHKLYTSEKLIILHAAGISLENGKSILFLGNTGQGKTSSLLEILLKNSNSKIISNNKSIVKYTNENKVLIIGGTKTLSIRQEKYKDEYNQIVHLKLKKYDRYFVNVLDERIEKKEIKCDAIIIPNINSLSNSFRIIEKEEAKFILFPFVLELINNEVILFDKIPISTFLEGETIDKQFFLNLVISILEFIPLYYIEGDPDFLVSKVQHLIK